MTANSGTSGRRFDFQGFPQGTKGGLQLYPLTGIISGFQVSGAAAAGTNNVNLTVNISAGQARLDGVLVTLPSNISTLVLPVGSDITVGTQTFNIYLNPRRLVQALPAPPSNPVVNDIYCKVVDNGDSLQILPLGFYQYDGTAWNAVNPSGVAPGYGFNNLPLNAQTPAVDTSTTNNKSFLLTAEKIVYHDNAMPAYVSAPSKAYFRWPSSLQLATITAVSGVFTIVSYSENAVLPQ